MAQYAILLPVLSRNVCGNGQRTLLTSGYKLPHLVNCSIVVYKYFLTNQPLLDLKERNPLSSTVVFHTQSPQCQHLHRILLLWHSFSLSRAPWPCGPVLSSLALPSRLFNSVLWVPQVDSVFKNDMHAIYLYNNKSRSYLVNLAYKLFSFPTNTVNQFDIVKSCLWCNKNLVQFLTIMYHVHHPTCLFGLSNVPVTTKVYSNLQMWVEFFCFLLIYYFDFARCFLQRLRMDGQNNWNDSYEDMNSHRKMNWHLSPCLFYLWILCCVFLRKVGWFVGFRSIKQCQFQSLCDQSHHLFFFFFQHWSQTGMGGTTTHGSYWWYDFCRCPQELKIHDYKHRVSEGFISSISSKI